MSINSKYYTADPILNVNVDSSMAKVIALADKGYWFLTNTKSYKIDLIISPEDLSKLVDNPKDGNTFNVGRSTYRLAHTGDFAFRVSAKLFLLTVEGGDLGKPTKSPKKLYTKYSSVPVIRGIINTLTKDIASAFVFNDKVGFWEGEHGSIVAMSSPGTLKDGSRYIFFKNQGKAEMRLSSKVKWVEVGMGVLFPSAFKKGKYKKDRIFFVK